MLLQQSANLRMLVQKLEIQSGRTRKEIKHSLFGLGMTDMKTLVLLDRNRLPFSTPNPKTYKSFWRVDFPSIGINNPINSGVNHINKIKDKLID